MNREFFAEVGEVFLAARGADRAGRESVLAERCAGRDELRRAVEEMLANDGHHSDGFDDSKMVEGVNLDALHGLMTTNGSPHEQRTRKLRELPETLGRFRIIRKLGEGGMGVVCEAEQDNPRRRVALKLLRAGVQSSAMLKRFAQEAQVLARLQHPGIARIHETGVIATASGDQPYFAMELITGRPLLEHAAALSVPERLALFLKVCSAVEYAHGRGIIHRDLKPMNILLDEHGHPRVLDFGVARVTNSDIQATTLHTDRGQLIGTLPYMSPEQIDGNLNEVDVRTDVYALGVVLYQMLSGKLPLDTRSKTIAEAARIIRDHEPTRLGSLDPTMRGDLETIVSRALEKSAARRYRSVSTLAADVERYLRHEPIEARPSSRVYLVRKFVRRHPELVAGVLVAMIVLIIGVAATTWGWLRAVGSQRESERLSAVLLSALGPGDVSSPEHAERAKRILNDAMTGLKFPLPLTEQSDLYARIAEKYRELGFYEEAVRFFGQALAVSNQARGGGHEQTIRLQGKVATAMVLGSPSHEQLAKAVAIAEEALSKATNGLGPEHELTQQLTIEVAWTRVRANKDPESRQVLAGFLAKLRADPNAKKAAIRQTLSRLGWYLEQTNDLILAEGTYRELVHLMETHPDASVLDHGSALRRLALTLDRQGRLSDSVDVYTQAFELLRAHKADEELPPMCWVIEERGRALLNLGRPEEAAKDFRLLCDQLAASRVSQLSNFETTRATRHEILAYALGAAGRTAECERELRVAMAAEQSVHGPGSSQAAAMEQMRALYVDIGIGGGWACPPVRSYLAVLALNVMDSADPERIRPLRWKDMRFRIERWSGSSAGGEVWSGGVEDLRKVKIEVAGIYLLSAVIPQRGQSPRDWQVWMLLSPWDVKLYDMPFDPPFTAGAWQALMASSPADSRRDWGLVWWDVFDGGFGPQHRARMFALTASTEFRLPAGEYQLEGVSDDGVEVVVNGAPVVTNLRTQWATQFKRTVTLGDQSTRLEVKYYQFLGGYQLRVTMNPVSAAAQDFARRVTGETMQDLERAMPSAGW